MEENKTEKKPNAGINGNRHKQSEFEHYGPLVYQLPGSQRPLPHGVTYFGDDEWKLPEGAEIESAGGEDWLLTMPDGEVFYVWSEG